MNNKTSNYVVKITTSIFCILLFSGLAMAEENKLEKATFGGGCFWCMEPPFEKLDGVKSVVSGYTGGTVDNPTYKTISTGTTGHAEVIQVTFDPSKVSYEKLLSVFWRNIDPTTLNAQFADRGTQYLSLIHISEPTRPY